jgi:hypothetical protein
MREETGDYESSTMKWITKSLTLMHSRPPPAKSPPLQRDRSHSTKRRVGVDDQIDSLSGKACIVGFMLTLAVCERGRNDLHLVDLVWVLCVVQRGMVQGFSKGRIGSLLWKTVVSVIY